MAYHRVESSVDGRVWLPRRVVTSVAEAVAVADSLRKREGVRASVIEISGKESRQLLNDLLEAQYQRALHDGMVLP